MNATTVAKRLGVEVASYSRMERGERRITLDRALVLARMLGCTVEQLGIEPTIDEQVAAMRSKLQREQYGEGSMTPEQVEAAFAAAQLDVPNSPAEKIAAGLNDAIAHARGSVVAQPAPHVGTSPSASDLDDEVKRMMTEWDALGDDEGA